MNVTRTLTTVTVLRTALTILVATSAAAMMDILLTQTNILAMVHIADIFKDLMLGVSYQL